MSIVLAIDPGASGGMAWHDTATRKTTCRPMPDTEGDILSCLSELAALSGDEPTCYLEEVGGFTGAPTPGSAMFNFGEGYGFIRGVLMALRYRVEMVRPQKWQAAMGIGNASSLRPEGFKDMSPERQKAAKAAAKTEWKRKLKSHAERLYPNQKVTLKTCDALLILDYGMEDCAKRIEAIYGQPN